MKTKYKQFYFDELNDIQKEILSHTRIVKIEGEDIHFCSSSQIVKKYGKNIVQKVIQKTIVDYVNKKITDKISKEIDEIILYGNPRPTTKFYKSTIPGLYDMLVQEIEEQKEKFHFSQELKLEFLETKTRLPLFIKEVIKL